MAEGLEILSECEKSLKMTEKAFASTAILRTSVIRNGLSTKDLVGDLAQRERQAL